jgi:hypothetical protein
VRRSPFYIITPPPSGVRNIGLGVDFAIKIRLAQDVFEASVGYVLPNDLKPEVRAVFDVHIVCIDHRQRCVLKKVDQTVILKEEIRRTLKNISDVAQPFPIFLAVDEWFNPLGRSQILNLGYSMGDKETIIVREGRLAQGEGNRMWMDDHVLHAEGKQVSLDAKKEIRIWQEFIEYKQANDDHFMFFTAPSKDPEVTFDVEDESGETLATAGFAHRLQNDVISRGPCTVVLPGTLLPLQSIQIRWWNKEANASNVKAQTKGLIQQ